MEETTVGALLRVLEYVHGEVIERLQGCCAEQIETRIEHLKAECVLGPSSSPPLLPAACEKARDSEAASKPPIERPHSISATVTHRYCSRSSRDYGVAQLGFPSGSAYAPIAEEGQVPG